MIETLGEAADAGWRLRARCDRQREGLKSVKPCIGLFKLDLQTVLWTSRRAYPAGRVLTTLSAALR